MRPVAAARRPPPTSSIPMPAAPAAPAATQGTVRELYQLLVQNGRWWLVPFLVVLGVTGVLLALVTAIEYVAPFVYTVF